jgi:hypothetical protein
MHDDREWAEIRPQSASSASDAGHGMLRLTLLFGSLAIAIALFVAPVLDRGNSSDLTASAIHGGLDHRATGTVGPTSRQYTVRRSVLQANRGATCIIHSNGIHAGDC